MSSEDFAIRAKNLGKTYRIYERPLDRLRQFLAGNRRQYGRAFCALSDVSFTLPKGEVLGVIGNNGAGKSTLLQLVCGILQPGTGEIAVNGRVAALLELGAGFNPEFTGRENIFLNAAVLGLPQQEIEARYADIVEFSGIGDFIEQPVKTYSSGMYVRLAFSIATSVEPDILVIDEALSVGDGAFARKSFDRIMALRGRGTTILFCSHSMYHIEAICDQVLWLERGQMKRLGAPSQVTSEYRNQLAEVPPAPPPDAPASSAGSAGPTPEGTGRILSIETDADGITGRSLQLRSGISNLGMTVFFQLDPSLPPPSIVFTLETANGTAVSSGGTFLEGVQLATGPDGCGQARLEFPALPLMRGTYRISVYLGCERSVHVYEQALHCAEIEVIQEGVEQGVVFLPHSWNGGPLKTVPGPRP